ncbi:MAG: PilZ domain-containing protein [Desulfuromonas sp.]|nr:PilZ domain-containing protein [Desulfuromonas sp.]
MENKKILISAQVKNLISFDSSFSEREGFTILTSQDATDLLTIARTQAPDIIFISPACTKDDRTCCRLLKEDSRINHIPVVAIVDSTKLAELNHVQHERPADVLFTPVNTHLFLASARRILGLASRAFPRQQTSLLIHFGLEPQDLHTACAFNLSTGGVFIATDNPPPIDAAIYIQLDLYTAEDSILCQGVVTWHNDISDPSRPEMPSGFGLQFASLKITDLFAIRTFIDELTKNGASPLEA